MSFTVVIPTKTASNLETCLAAIRENEPAARVIVVDDGLPAGYQIPPSRALSGWTHVIPGAKPFCFARNSNIGIRAATPADVILLNDDALLQTPWGFTNLSLAARSAWPIVGAVTNQTGNPPQRKTERTQGTRSVVMVAFQCVYLRRDLLDRIGLLDEEFTDYGGDDDDFCLRARQSGHRVGVCDGCYVDHLSLPSSYRGEGRQVSFDHNNAVFFKKHQTTPDAVRQAWDEAEGLPWGDPDPGWECERHLELLGNLLRDFGSRTVLEVGACGPSTVWLAYRSWKVAVTAPTNNAFCHKMAAAGVWGKMVTVGAETFKADVVYVHGNRDVASIREDLTKYQAQAQKAICGSGYQRESIRQMLATVLPGHGACGGFWWMMKR